MGANMKNKFKFLVCIFLINFIIGINFVHAGYSGNYGYEYYDSYDYGHSYGNSWPNNYWKPNLVYITSCYIYDNGLMYRSGFNSQSN